MKFWPVETRKWALVVISTLVVFAAPMFAQSSFMRLRGQVTDPSGAVIPGASISVKSAGGAATTSV